MTDLWRIEGRLLVRSGSWWALILTLSGVAVGSLLVGRGIQEREGRTIVALTVHQDSVWRAQVEDARLFETGRLNPEYLSPLDGYLTWGFTNLAAGRRVPELAMLSIGQADLFPTYHVWGNVAPNTLFHEREISNPTTQALGWLDFSVVLVLFVPLVLIGLSFDAAPRDRSSGIAPLLMGQGARPSTVYARRSVVAWAALMVVFVPLVTCTVLILSPGVRSTTGALALIWLAGIVVGYAAFWQATIFLVNSFGRSATWNATALILIWTVATLVGPPTLDGFVGGGGTEQIDEDMERWIAEFALDTDAAYQALRLDLLPDSALGEEPTGSQATIARLESLRRSRDSTAETWGDALIERERRVRAAASALPSAVVGFALVDLGGNDVASLLDYAEARRDFEAQWTAAMMRRPVTGTDYSIGELEGAPVWTPPAVPPTRTWAALVLLWGQALAVAGLGWISFRRREHPSR
ncbi:MAG: hypothetical protein AAF389_06610 [Gemmatimonadota bacterium]